MSLLPFRSGGGVDYQLEEDADRLLAEDRRRNGVQDDYLSKDQMNLRRMKEVYNANGISDETLFAGLFKRAYNPNSSSRPTRANTRGSE